MLTTEKFNSGKGTCLVKNHAVEDAGDNLAKCKPSPQCSLGSLKRKPNWIELEDDYGNPTKVCLPIKAAAYVRGSVEPKVCVLLKFKDDQGKTHSLLVPKAECKDSKRLIERLVNCGWDYYCPKKTILVVLNELLDWCHPQTNLLRVEKPGWHRNDDDDEKVFVYGDKIFAPHGKKAKVFFAGNSPFKIQGSLEEWKQFVAKLFDGNSRQILLLSAAFAGPLLSLVKQPNIGILLHGASRAGKTATLAAVCSVYGNDEMMGSWKATANALLQSAVHRNDLMLPLDELSQAKAADAGDAAYDLMNGISKARLGADIKMQDISRFRLVAISTGEQSFPSFLAKHGLIASNGQLARMVSIPFSSKGVFENTHGYKKPENFATTLVTNAATHFGSAGPEFIQYLVNHQHQIEQSAPSQIDDIQEAFLTTCGNENTSGLQHDVAKRLATIAFAGELAIKIGILPFKAGAAIRAATSCFKAWNRQNEAEAVVRDPVFATVKEFFIDNHTSFIPFSQHKTTTDLFSGFTHTVNGITAFLIMQDTFQSRLCVQHGKQAVIFALKNRGLLMLGARSTPTKQIAFPGSQKKQSFYVVNSLVLNTV